MEKVRMYTTLMAREHKSFYSNFNAPFVLFSYIYIIHYNTPTSLQILQQGQIHPSILKIVKHLESVQHPYCSTNHFSPPDILHSHL